MAKTREKYRLGLDIGVASLGWSVLRLDKNGDPEEIIEAGSRIFSEGRDNKTKSTLAATRREKRSARRRRGRFKQRQTWLLSLLGQHGLFPAETQEKERRELQNENPLKLRAQALSKKLPLHLVGRALFHINQRRGFKSNRKDRSEEVTSGKVSQSSRALLEEMRLLGPAMKKDEYKELSKEDKKKVRLQEAKARRQALEKLQQAPGLTYGSFLYQRLKEGKSTRARPGAGDDGKLYDVYPTRELYEDEFQKIWGKQAKYHPEQMTDEAKRSIHQAIFHQRPLKPQKRGKCTYMAGEDRTFRAMPSFQRYRICQEVNALTWQTSTGERRLRDYPDACNTIVDMLEATEKKQISFPQMKKVLKSKAYAEGNFTFNFESPKRKGFQRNSTSHYMQQEDCIGPEWHEWSMDKQDDFIALILDDKKTDDEVHQCLMAKYDLSAEVANECLGAPLEDGAANISLRAARLMLEKMQEEVVDDAGVIYLRLQYEAAEAVDKEAPDFTNPLRRKSIGDDFVPEARLPYYGEAFQDGGHIIPGTLEPEDKGDDRKYFGGVTNPTVHIALNQIRQVVNELIERFGHPYSIAIELGRELPAGADKRREIEKEQSDYQKKNEKHNEILEDFGEELTRDNRLRIRLWEELDEEDPNGRLCPFSGDKIGLGDLFSGKIEVDHLIPFSDSLDDSRANKVVCFRKANRDKGNRTPYEAFGDSPSEYKWHEIFERAERLPKSKQWRFLENAREIWRRDHGDDFLARHLNDTRYIGRLTHEYLQLICHQDRIDVLTGRLTSLLRGLWGLNSVLSDDRTKKNRDDHRHHAVDAIVIGMTNRSMLQKVATVAGKAEDMQIERLFEKKEASRPWKDFRRDVAQVVGSIIVSHKAKKKKIQWGTPEGEVHRTTDGQLHRETAYGIVSKPDDNKDIYEVVTRWNIQADCSNSQIAEGVLRRKLEQIRDSRLKKAFLNAFNQAGDLKAKKIAVKALADKKGIRRLRCVVRLSVIPIQDKKGEIYKAYQGSANWGMEIYSHPEDEKEKWKYKVISRFDANQKEFQPGQTYRPHPAARLVMRLQINDCVEIEENETKTLWRVQKIGQTGTIFFTPLNEANVAARNDSKDDPFKYRTYGAYSLWKHKAKKVHISPTGVLSYENRVPKRKNSPSK